MKNTFETIRESVFIEKWGATALILHDRIILDFRIGKYMDEKQLSEYLCIEHPGIVQSSNDFKKAKAEGVKSAIESDPLAPYEELYNELRIYAEGKYKVKFN